MLVIGRNESEITRSDRLTPTGEPYLTATSQHIDFMLPGMSVIGAAAACSDSEFPHREVGSIAAGADEHALLHVANLFPVVIDTGFDVVAMTD